MKINRDSYSMVAVTCVVTLCFIFLGGAFVNAKWVFYPITVALLLYLFFIIWFHRVPNRVGVGNDKIVTSVADGKVLSVTREYEGEYLHRECIKISVFMSPFNVHTNFWPITGVVSYSKYHPGKNLVAFRPKSSEFNEHASVAISNVDGTEVFYKQIAGILARRIVSYASEGLHVVSGEECGIIKFGSRLDHFLPLDADVRVKPGDTVRACLSIIAELK